MENNIKRRCQELLVRSTKPQESNNFGYSNWVDRIALLAEQAKLNTGAICWQGAPTDVAYAVVRAAEAQNALDCLMAVLAGKT